MLDRLDRELGDLRDEVVDLEINPDRERCRNIEERLDCVICDLLEEC